MPIYSVQTHKRIGTGRPWTNVWHVTADDLATVIAAVSGTLVPAESHALADTVTIFKAVISDLSSSDFASLPLATAGLVADPGLLPLFNTMRVLFAVADFGRNDCKYWRGYLGEGNTEASLIGSSARTGAETIFGDLILDMAAVSCSLVDKLGNFYDTATVQSAIQERQLHRKRRRSA